MEDQGALGAQSADRCVRRGAEIPSDAVADAMRKVFGSAAPADEHFANLRE